MKIVFGVMVPSLKDQLVKTKIKDEDIEQFQKEADAITMLHIRGTLTFVMAQSARKRLLKKIAILDSRSGQE